jgi:group I intron endonuclease
VKKSCIVPFGIACVYEIHNTKTGRSYIGSTNRYPYRFREHRNALAKGVHGCKQLQRSFDKHGGLSFVMRPVEIVTDPSSIYSREQFWIDRLGRRSVYNSKKIVQGPSVKSAKVIRICVQTGKRRIYKNSKEAALDIFGKKERFSSIDRACRKPLISAGFYWTKDRTDTAEEIQNRIIKRKQQKKERHEHSVFAFDANGALVGSFFGLKDASKKTGLPYASISAAINSKGKFRRASGVFWSRTTVPPLTTKDPRQKPIAQFSGNDLVFVFDSVVDAVSSVPGTTLKGVYETACGRQKQHGGYKWEYVKT